MLLIWFYNKPKNIGFNRINWELLNDTDTIRLIDYVIVYDDFAPFGIAEHLQEFVNVVVTNPEYFYKDYRENTTEIFIKFDNRSMITSDILPRTYNNKQSTFYADKDLVDQLKLLKSIHSSDIVTRKK